jgi:hypothetical protein
MQRLLLFEGLGPLPVRHLVKFRLQFCIVDPEAVNSSLRPQREDETSRKDESDANHSIENRRSFRDYGPLTLPTPGTLRRLAIIARNTSAHRWPVGHRTVLHSGTIDR